MKAEPDRIKSLAETLAALLDGEQRACQEEISSLIESVRVIQGDTADRRLQRLTAQLKKLKERLGLLSDMARRDFLAKITREAEAMTGSLTDGRIAQVLAALLDLHAPSLNHFCESLIDHTIEATQAERGFILFYFPESTEAEVIAARRFQTKNLSLEEYDFSRTLLGAVFNRGEPLLVEDACHDPTYSQETSVRALELKSVLAVPLLLDRRTVGAVYLENNSLPCAFNEEDLQLLESVARFAVFYLQHARLLPVVFEPDRRVFFDASRASREIVGQDPTVLSLLETINRVADSAATILIEGESGTGKELVARALHYQSRRRDRPFVTINCAAIPDNLLESELFGHEKGAFTGAVERSIGRIERGDGGTIFLDEVSELAYALQAKLLRFLQSGEFERLGGKETLRVDVRVVAATSKNLKAMMGAGEFQEPLYYRLNVIPIRVPTLAERTGDIPLLADHFLEKFSAAYGKTVRIERDVYGLLAGYPFPGNVRELENLIHRLVILAPDDSIRIGDLPREIMQTSSQRIALTKDPLDAVLRTPPAHLEDMRRRKKQMKRLLDEQERQLIERAIEEAGGNLSDAAKRLGVHRVTLHKLLKK
jgi:Nif-specific regulatory protein